MPFCNQCGADVAGVKFCSKCGSPVTESATASGAPAADGPTAGGTQSAPAGGGTTAQTAGGEVSENVAAALAYITPVAIVLLLIEPYKSNRFVRFHSFQSIFYFVASVGLGIALAIVSTILSIAGIGFLLALIYPLFQLAVFVVWILLVVKAYQGQTYKLPVVGDFAEKQL